jgi:hypothetical protein
MKILKYTLAIISLIMLGLAIWIQTWPGQFTVQRRASIDAPVAQVFSLVADFHHRQKWDPFIMRTPAMKRTISETSSGLGAKQQWESETEGSGYETTETFEENRLICNKVVFVKPHEATVQEEFAFESISQNQTRITWTRSGQTKSLSMKLLFPLLDVPAAMGQQIEEGLKHLGEAVKQP